MNDLKYLLAYSIPIIAIISLHLKGSFVFLTPFYVFVIIPLLDHILPQDSSNLSKEQSKKKVKNPVFDWMLYANVFIVFGILIYTLFDISNNSYKVYELVGLIISTGIVLGSNGINVAHELGHRSSKIEQFLAKFLLLPSLYMHFYIEHNYGHHLNAATKEDPATARYNQSIYSFWFSSVIRQYQSAWKIQNKLLRNNNASFLSVKNDMLWYLIIQVIYLLTIYFVFDSIGLLFALSTAIVGFLLLESINYIEHYGLIRNKLPSGRYERVQEIHSWNSNHIMGRVVLYELTRHSDHHYKSSKKYQLLNYHDISPQMPYGYPASMVMSLIPPLWFKIMNKHIPEKMKPTL